MPRLTPLKPREAEKILLFDGFVVNIRKSSHRQYYNPKTKAHVTVPFHSKDLAMGTLRSVIRQSQLPIDLFKLLLAGRIRSKQTFRELENPIKGCIIKE